MKTLEQEYQLHHKKIEAVMHEDAKLNGIPVSRLNPASEVSLLLIRTPNFPRLADYGLGIDPRDSKIYASAKQQEAICDKMWLAGKDVEATFRKHCAVSVRPKSISLDEVVTF